MQCCNQISLYWLLAFFASVCCGNKCEISCQNFGRLLAQFVPLGNLTARSVAHLVPVMQCRTGALGASQFQPTNYLKTRKTNVFQQQLIAMINRVINLRKEKIMVKNMNFLLKFLQTKFNGVLISDYCASFQVARSEI
jgi:hypothetical protein